ncbi:MAG: hypothetical protein Q9222_007575 [Ikaeria aurantiellina]
MQLPDWEYMLWSFVCRHKDSTAASLAQLREHHAGFVTKHEDINNIQRSLQDQLSEHKSEVAARFQEITTRSDELQATTAGQDARIEQITLALEELKKDSRAIEEDRQKYQDLLKDSSNQILRKASADLMEQVNVLTGALEDQNREFRAAVTTMQTTIHDLKEQMATMQSNIAAGIWNKAFSQQTPETTAEPVQNLDDRRSEEPRIFQGTMDLEKYIVNGNTFVRDMRSQAERGKKQQAESQAVQDFVQGLAVQEQRAIVSKALDRKGWTWAKAKRELQQFIPRSNTRRRSERLTKNRPPRRLVEE